MQDPHLIIWFGLVVVTLAALGTWAAIVLQINAKDKPPISPFGIGLFRMLRLCRRHADLYPRSWLLKVYVVLNVLGIGLVAGWYLQR
jgi:hypothetical protein